MVAAMAGFALEDVLFKQLAATLPVGQVMALIGIGGGCIFCVIARVNGHRVVSRQLLSGPILLRNLSEALGSAFFMSALALSTLSGVSAILQATPLTVTLGAALFLGEAVGWRRWAAIGIGFLGVLLIVQPGTSAFEPASLFAVAAVMLLAVRDLSSRAVPAGIASAQLAAWGFLSTVPAGLILLLATHTPPVMLDSGELLRVPAILLVGGVGYYCLIAATRTGEVTAVVPFRYTRLVFALVLGRLIFGERPDTLMITGAVLIVATGLYTIWRTAVRRASPA